jgi:predicted RNase H-like HicB family nuclease
MMAHCAAEADVDFSMECEHEEDWRRLAEVPRLPGVLSYGATADEAIAKAEVLALRVIAERFEHGETRAPSIRISVTAT